MKIFIGSSREEAELMRHVEVWLEEQDIEAVPWDKPGLFIPGSNTFHRLIEISRQVQGAIFIFSEDDKVWYRADTVTQPRDNILIEYGLFAGALGPHKAIILKNGQPKTSSDLQGISYIDITANRRNRGKLETNIWCRNLSKEEADPALIQFQAKIYQLQREKNEIEDRLKFEEDKARELSIILTESGVINFKEYNLNEDGHWKLLFNFDYIFQVSKELTITFQEPKHLIDFLKKIEANEIVNKITWYEQDKNRLPFYIRKVMRVYRMRKSNEYLSFINALSSEKQRIDIIGEEVVAKETIR